MARWRELAAAVVQVDQTSRDVRPSYGLPDDLAAQLRQLGTLPAPQKLESPDQWRVVVRDALTIARAGWAASALSLGWSSLDLFGVGERDSLDFAGLATWLEGRTIVALDERVAVAVGEEGRDAFVRGGLGHGKDARTTPVHLWDFGRS